MNENENVKIKLERHRWPDEIERQKRKRRIVYITTLLIIMSFSFGWIFGSVFSAPSNNVVTDHNIARFERVYNRILKNWYFINDMENPQKQLIENAIKGMLEKNGDIHTSYMTKEESDELATSIDMRFVGIGVQYYPGENLNLITRVYKDSPAEKAGLKSGDILYSIDGAVLSTLSEEDDLKNYILGEEGTVVNVVVERNGEKLSFDIIRGEINALTWGEVVAEDIGYLEISSFGNGLKESTEIYLRHFKEKGIRKLILDFRDNGGGYLDAINNLSSLFFDDGTVIYREEFTNGTQKVYEVSGSKRSEYNFDNIVLLINENSASASEVFALAMKENLKTPLVGMTSYGKGTVQTQIRDALDNSYLKYTMAKWFSPNGVNIHGTGIAPDYEVRLPEIFYTALVNLDGEVVGYDQVNEAVAYVQKGLSFLGYHQGRTDGYYDQTTKEALIAFKRKANLGESDAINDEVVRRVYASVLAEWSQNKMKYDVQLHKAIEVIQSGS